jgi:hypothetical protein
MNADMFDKSLSSPLGKDKDKDPGFCVFQYQLKSSVAVSRPLSVWQRSTAGL